MAIFKKKTENTDSKAKGKEVKPSMKDLYAGQLDSPAAAKTDGPKAAKAAGNSLGTAYKTLIKPLITEKAADLAPLNKYYFEIGINSNKIEVARAVEEVYGIKPVSVNISRISGKKVRQGRRMGQRRDWKKAVVTLPQGKTINIYEGV